MSIDPLHLRKYIIKPACETLGLYSLAAEELLLGTACQESHCGRYLSQLGDGPARGIFQMEPATHDDIHRNFLKFKLVLRGKVNRLSLRLEDADEMRWNLLYAAAMCRLHYFRVKQALPVAGDLDGQASYWKRFYNTSLGKGTTDEYRRNWQRFTA